MSSSPGFGGWLKLYALDLLSMLAMGMVGLGVYFADPAPTRSFAVDFSDGEIIYPQFAYPLRNEIIPIWAAAMIAFFVPFVVFCIVQIRVRSFEDFNCAVFGVLYSLINAAVFQVFIKWLIGGLRPHFLTVCAPVIPEGIVGNGFQSIYFTRSICTGDAKEINDSLESMPSGHSTAAWAGLLFLSLYLNGHLKIFADTRSQFWKMIVFFAPLLGAFLITGALTIDEYHNWLYDCLAGAIIGSCSAIASYRLSYASIWDFRFNHVPLPRDTKSVGRFPYTLESANAGNFSHFAGAWRDGAPVKGAPGDAVQGGGLGGGVNGTFGAGQSHHHHQQGAPVV
ncbi:phosphatidic acid phosphatase type 2/haloperoxidase [Leucosporidium creatinivorum]|uniref:Phosphatidic acid phosphatase type 2/haloperoxidase n=1 Tax=Leucosporidium creatinivorum TaxID=106004 RepID=A0A1Y2DRN7_9BASI|nr:phosphatidic acid phosphatase type 2/haloperoxidase [Leucosporidium creatinivorum]